MAGSFLGFSFSRLEKEVIPTGSLENYMERTFDTQALLFGSSEVGTDFFHFVSPRLC